MLFQTCNNQNVVGKSKKMKNSLLHSCTQQLYASPPWYTVKKIGEGRQKPQGNINHRERRGEDGSNLERTSRPSTFFLRAKSLSLSFPTNACLILDEIRQTSNTSNGDSTASPGNLSQRFTISAFNSLPKSFFPYFESVSSCRIHQHQENE